jgi:hypothetical protein
MNTKEVTHVEGPTGPVRHWLVVAVPQWRQARSGNSFFERCGCLDVRWSEDEEEKQDDDEDEDDGNEDELSSADGSEGEVEEGACWLW